MVAPHQDLAPTDPTVARQIASVTFNIVVADYLVSHSVGMKSIEALDDCTPCLATGRCDAKFAVGGALKAHHARDAAESSILSPQDVNLLAAYPTFWGHSEGDFCMAERLTSEVLE